MYTVDIDKVFQPYDALLVDFSTNYYIYTMEYPTSLSLSINTSLLASAHTEKIQVTIFHNTTREHCITIYIMPKKIQWPTQSMQHMCSA